MEEEIGQLQMYLQEKDEKLNATSSTTQQVQMLGFSLLFSFLYIRHGFCLIKYIMYIHKVPFISKQVFCAIPC